MQRPGAIATESLHVHAPMKPQATQRTSERNTVENDDFMRVHGPKHKPHATPMMGPPSGETSMLAMTVTAESLARPKTARPLARITKSR